jgi:hypothetical protein
MRRSSQSSSRQETCHSGCGPSPERAGSEKIKRTFTVSRLIRIAVTANGRCNNFASPGILHVASNALKRKIFRMKWLIGLLALLYLAVGTSAAIDPNPSSRQRRKDILEKQRVAEWQRKRTLADKRPRRAECDAEGQCVFRGLQVLMTEGGGLQFCKDCLTAELEGPWSESLTTYEHGIAVLNAAVHASSVVLASLVVERAVLAPMLVASARALLTWQLISLPPFALPLCSGHMGSSSAPS